MSHGKARAELFFLTQGAIDSLVGGGNDSKLKRKNNVESLSNIRQALTCKYCKRVFRKSFARIHHVRQIHPDELNQETQKLTKSHSRFKREVRDDDDEDLVVSDVDYDDDDDFESSDEEAFPEAVEYDRSTWEMLARLPEFKPKVVLRDVYEFEETAYELPPKPVKTEEHNEDYADSLGGAEGLSKRVFVKKELHDLNKEHKVDPDRKFVKKKPPDMRTDNKVFEDVVISIDCSDDEESNDVGPDRRQSEKSDDRLERLIKQEPRQELPEPALPKRRLRSRDQELIELESSDDESEESDLECLSGNSPNALESRENNNALPNRLIKQEHFIPPPAKNRMLYEEVFFVHDSSDEEMESHSMVDANNEIAEADSPSNGRAAAASVRRFAATPTPRV